MPRASELADARFPSDKSNQQKNARAEPNIALREESPFERFDPIRRRIPREKLRRQGRAKLWRIKQFAQPGRFGVGDIDQRSAGEIRPIAGGEIEAQISLLHVGGLAPQVHRAGQRVCGTDQRRRDDDQPCREGRRPPNLALAAGRIRSHEPKEACHIDGQTNQQTIQVAVLDWDQRASGRERNELSQDPTERRDIEPT